MHVDHICVFFLCFFCCVFFFGCIDRRITLDSISEISSPIMRLYSLICICLKDRFSRKVAQIHELYISRRYSPVMGQVYLLKIASIYGNFTPIGGYFGVFLENRVCAKGHGLYAKNEKAY